MNTPLQDLTKQLFDACTASKLDTSIVCEALQTCYTSMNAENPLRLVDYEFNGLRVEIDRKTATKDGKPVDLTPNEWKIVVALIKANGKKLSKNDLHTVVYGDDVIASNTTEVFLSHLRRKIGKGFISTYRGQGYVISNLVH
jgi:DNA-binding response OmpR family regulator